ncbi:MAG: type II/IV secretion system protein [Puniceicoccales bacterium]|jgi:type II secretory ATPase GspE/PulE/Tfp pilus assembly ATPase PilB-like protein|nr:type II/IV secretion system protein [Puniceicoccales bacterium]
MSTLSEKLSELGQENFNKIVSEPVQRRMGLLAKTLGYEEEKEAAVWLCNTLEIPFVENFQLDRESIKKLPATFFTLYGVLPIKDVTEENKLCIISCWPLDVKVCQQIEIFCGQHPEICLGVSQDIISEMVAYFGFEKDESMVIDVSEEEEIEDESDEKEEAIVVKFVNDTIRRALKSRATDIHFEPQRNSLHIRYRIDGDLVPVRVPENLVKFQAAIISRLKIMASLNISEKRRPQDGKIAFKDGDAIIDIRVSTLPVVYGESVSLRLLVQGGNAPVSLRDLDMSEYQLKITEKALAKPHGIILVTGPTGSGKSTTLSTFLKHVSSPEIRLITVEDPVEYEISGVNQSQVHAEIGLTFASVLRSILRQDPDVIMLGEIRDSESGDIAVRASVTGHLVVSTLHTNDAVGSITRLKDIGIASYMIASALEMVCAQRLVRRLCPHCAKVSAKLNNPAELQRLKDLFKINKLPADVQLMEAAGCEHCNGIGYRGRMAVFEILGMNEHIHEAIVSGATESEIRDIAMVDGMTFLAQDAFVRACRGLTTVEEAIQLIP